jgi:hypothetical protein
MDFDVRCDPSSFMLKIHNNVFLGKGQTTHINI